MDILAVGEMGPIQLLLTPLEKTINIYQISKYPCTSNQNSA